MHEIPAAMTTAPGRGRVRASGLFTASAVIALAVSAPACKLDQKGVEPPLDRIAFPASAVVDPGGDWLYVANSNSDLRYNDGTLVAVDIDAALRDRFGAADYTAPVWNVCPGADYVRVDTDPFACCWDWLDHQILDCDERLYVPAASTIKMGSFAAGMLFQDFRNDPECADDGGAAAAASRKTRSDCDAITRCASAQGQDVYGRVYIGVRGNSSLSYVDVKRVFDPTLKTRRDLKPGETAADLLGRSRPVFSCSDPKSASPDVCQVTDTIPDMPGSSEDIHVPDEPYALALDQQQDLLYVGNLRGDTSHQQTGGISLFDVKRPTWLSVPTFIGPSSSLFSADANGNFGITSLTQRADGAIYAASRYGITVVNVVTSFPPGDICSNNPETPITVSPGSDSFTTPLVGAEIRGIQFLPEGNRAFVLQRTPPALVGFDISTAPQAYGNFPSDVLETCSSPTFLQAYDAGEGTRLYVTCFDAGQIYVFDPYVPRLIGVINAGRGPAGLAFPPSPGAHAVAYIVGFSANDMAVVDIQPGSATQYHVVQRIGFPSLVPR